MLTTVKSKSSLTTSGFILGFQPRITIWTEHHIPKMGLVMDLHLYLCSAVPDFLALLRNYLALERCCIYRASLPLDPQLTQGNLVHISLRFASPQGSPYFLSLSTVWVKNHNLGKKNILEDIAFLYLHAFLLDSRAASIIRAFVELKWLGVQDALGLEDSTQRGRGLNEQPGTNHLQNPFSDRHHSI